MSALPPNYWETLPLGSDVKVLTFDQQGLGALDKGAGIRSHPNDAKPDSRALLTVPYTTEGEFFQWTLADGSTRRLWLLNRLDAATSGVILVASNEALALAVKTQFARKGVRKIYQALVFGKPPMPNQVWRDRLAVEKRGGQIRTHASGHVPAESVFSLVKMRPGEPPLSLIQLQPLTGRSHQLRVQCAKRKLPIVGDATYGDFGANREFAKRTRLKRLFLHSLETRFEYEFAGKKKAFHAMAPLPSEFKQAMA